VLVMVLTWLCAVLLAGGLAAAQIFLGGWWYPALAAPSYLLAASAAILAGSLFWKTRDAPGAWSVGTTLVMAGYFLWRQAESADAYVAREDQWLLLGGLCVYFTAAWQLRCLGTRWLVLGVLAFLSVAQTGIALVQFTAASQWHPLADWALHMGLPSGDGAAINLGFVSGTLASRGSFSAVLLPSAFLFLGMLVWGRGGVILKMLLFWITAVTFAGLGFSLSRAAYLALPVGLIVFVTVSFFVLRRGALSHRWGLSAAVLVLVGFFLVFVFSLGTESFLIQSRLSIIGVDEFRERLWLRMIPPMLTLDPWMGAGANMFDQLAARYRTTDFASRPVHAHNDWLQLLVEYGRVGLFLGLTFFACHFAAGWRKALRLAREHASFGQPPQSMELGLLTGSLAALSAVAVHSFFDYRLHIPAVALLVALCAGWLAGAGNSRIFSFVPPCPRWLLPLALILPAVPGVFLFHSVWGEAPAERHALQAENALISGDAGEAWDQAMEGLRLSSSNPRLLLLAGESASVLGNVASSRLLEKEWYSRSAQYFNESVRERPYFAYAQREYARALDLSGGSSRAFPVFLRAIGRDPNNAQGYEYLAMYYLRQGQLEEAARLLRLAKNLPGVIVAYRYSALLEAELRKSER